jgi:phospholipid/cholesterol/gamma-HCH transport system ATP-binding protein
MGRCVAVGDSLAPYTVAMAASRAILRFDGVTIRFDERTVLDNVTLTAEPGETKVIYGAAGSGKTMLMKAGIGLVPTDGGNVVLLGKDITNLDEKQLFPLRRDVGVLFQEGGLFDSLTVEENVSYPLLYQPDQRLSRSELAERVEEALSFVGLADTMAKYPSELSGGMRRRVGIARAAVTKPPLMLYDSPTAGLDPITAFLIMSLALRQRDSENTTLFVITHRYQDGKLLANYRFDPASQKIVRSLDKRRTRFVVLRDGRIVFEGSEAELLASSDPYVSAFSGRPSRPALTHAEHNLPEDVAGGKSLVRL